VFIIGKEHHQGTFQVMGNGVSTLAWAGSGLHKYISSSCTLKDYVLGCTQNLLKKFSAAASEK
jgi:hypothetical protein